jgi:hypothetical protein
MKKRPLFSLAVALAVVCFGLTLALWLRNFDRVIGQLGDRPDWKVVLCPRDYFVGLYGTEIILVAICLWAYRRHP